VPSGGIFLLLIFLLLMTRDKPSQGENDPRQRLKVRFAVSNQISIIFK